MSDQLLLGEFLRDEGMAAAEDHANSELVDWSDRALWLLWDFLATNKQPFMAEDVRLYAKGRGLATPPSKRAWGSVMIRAKKEGMIQFVDYDHVKNPKAHCANAAVWRCSNGFMFI